MYACFLRSIDKIIEFIEALKDENWVQDMKDKIVALESNKMWALVHLPTNKHTGCK